MSFSYKYIIFTILLSIIFSILVFCYFPFYNIVGAEKSLDGLLLLSSISLGFFSASLTVLASIMNTKVLKEIMNDEEEKKELMIVLSLTLLIGFLTVIITIVYQVLFTHDGTYIDIINAIWFFFVSLFISMKILFILIIFMILFNNKEDDESDSENKIYNPRLKESMK